MRITWVTRSFLDYRVPVYRELDELCGHQLTLIYNGEAVPERCQSGVRDFLGYRAIGMSGEVRIGNKHQLGVANKGIRIPIQKGLIKAISQSKPVVIVSDGFFQWTYAPLLMKILHMTRAGHVMCYEKTHHTERNAPDWRLKYRKFVSRWIDAIDCNGSLCEKFVSEKLGFEKKITNGHMVADTNGVALAVENATTAEVAKLRDSLELKGLTFIYVGRLIPLKGIMQLLSAWREASIDNATLMLVGDGAQRGEIEAYVRDNGLDNVRVVGAVNYDDLGPYYKVADCFIIPTLEDNWSLVVPEAMAAGLPVACSIYNGCHPELVTPENGWTFDPLNIDNTVSVLKSISAAREKLVAMGEASRKIVANHTPAHAAQGIYDACLAVMQDIGHPMR